MEKVWWKYYVLGWPCYWFVMIYPVQWWAMENKLFMWTLGWAGYDANAPTTQDRREEIGNEKRTGHKARRVV